jgi:hypothetical protein
MTFLAKKTHEGTRNPKFIPGGLQSKPANSESYELEISDAPEPSDIIWENLQISDRQVKCRECGVCFTVALLLVLVLLLFTTMKYQAGKNANKYPLNTDCKAVDSLFLKMK